MTEPACTDINKAGNKLFTKKSSVLRITPTRAALEQHVKRAFQSGHVSEAKHFSHSLLFLLRSWGWIKTDGLYEPHRTTLPEASKTCYELVACGCKKGCVKNCKCKKLLSSVLLSVSVKENVQETDHAECNSQVAKCNEFTIIIKIN